MFIDTLCTAVPVDENLKSTIGNFISKRIVKTNSPKEATGMPSMVDFDIEEDSKDEEQLLQRILSRVNVLNPHGQQQKLRNLPKTKLLSRSRRSIFGKDDRNLVETSVKAQTYPFSTVIYLSSGCTGTLVGVQHVLTAAHCVHDGRKFLKQARNLRIGKCLHSFIIIIYHEATNCNYLTECPTVKNFIFGQNVFFRVVFLNYLHSVATKGRHLQGNFLTISQQFQFYLSKGLVLLIASLQWNGRSYFIRYSFSEKGWVTKISRHSKRDYIVSFLRSFSSLFLLIITGDQRSDSAFSNKLWWLNEYG